MVVARVRRRLCRGGVGLGPAGEGPLADPHLGLLSRPSWQEAKSLLLERSSGRSGVGTSSSWARELRACSECVCVVAMEGLRAAVRLRSAVSSAVLCP
jgi:hypothetical protein